MSEARCILVRELLHVKAPSLYWDGAYLHIKTNSRKGENTMVVAKTKEQVQTETFNIYFYNGFEEPKKLTNHLSDVKDIVIEDNYVGDLTPFFAEDMKENGYLVGIEGQEAKNDFNEVLSGYNMILNPDVEDLVLMAQSWFDSSSIPYHHFRDFGTDEQVYDIWNRRYDCTKTYRHFKNKYIIDVPERRLGIDTVMYWFDFKEEAVTFFMNMDINGILLRVDKQGNAYYI